MCDLRYLWIATSYAFVIRAPDIISSDESLWPEDERALADNPINSRHAMPHSQSMKSQSDLWLYWHNVTNVHLFWPWIYIPGARFTNDFFYRNSNSMGTSPCCNSAPGRQIATNFCTAVVPCTNFCSGHCIIIKGRVKRNFHRIWIAVKKPLVKRGPGHFMRWTHGIDRDYMHQEICSR